MLSRKSNLIPGGVLGLALMLAAAPALDAQVQNRLALPRGSVILVRTATPLESSTARVGQTFETNIIEALSVDGYNVIPAGSRIRGVVRTVQPATRSQSGVMELAFDQLTLSDGTVFPLVGRLTSTDSAERRQIDATADQRVVLVGGRGGIGAAIAGAGSSSGSSSLLTALGGLLSEGQNVRVPAGTPLAVRLDQRLLLRGRGTRNVSDASTIYTDAERIRQAQRALQQADYYRGAIDGEMSYATQRALIEYQIDQRLTATGNLDGRTAQALGLSLGAGGTANVMMSAEEASTLRRNAQMITSRVRTDLGVSTLGRLDTRRAYSESDIELIFALSAFADNTSLHEQIVRTSGSSDGVMQAGRALISAARRVDAAMQSARPTMAVANAWTSMRSSLMPLDATYR